MRQTIKDLEYIAYAIKDRTKYIEELNGDLVSVNPVELESPYIFEELYFQQLRLFYLKYTMDATLDELKSIAIAAVNNFLMAENHISSTPSKFKTYTGVYHNALRFASLAVLFDATDLLVKLRTSFQKNKKGMDLILDLFFAKVLQTETVSDKLCFPKIYGDLAKLEVNNPATIEAGLQVYMSDWYLKMKKTEWHDLHKKSKVNGPTSFYGYWALEAAALVKLFDLDATLFKDFEYFPFDLLNKPSK